jgi:hypothetical protein
MKITVKKAKNAVVQLGSLKIKDTFRRATYRACKNDFLLIGNNSMLQVNHSSGLLRDDGARLLVYNIDTGVIGSMLATVEVVKTDAEMVIYA